MAQLAARGKALIDKVAAQEDLRRTTSEIVRICKPKNWNVHIDGNATVQNELDYGLMVLSMQQHTTKDVNKLTIMQFYHLQAWIQIKNKPNGR